MTEPQNNPAIEALLIFLRDNRGFDFTGCKRPSLVRRVSRRMEDVGIETFEQYHDYLEVHPDEFAYLFNTILINVTSFFRDEETWEYLAEEIVPQIIERSPDNQEIRVWSAGCAGGEEAYTLAMVFAEALGIEDAIRWLKIYATDVDEEGLAQARQGGYRPEAVETVPGGLRDKYFDLSGGRYDFRSDLRRCVVFGRHDLIQDAPISRLDLLACRNTLIYLNAETQRQVLARFHFALNDDGFLFLGKSEMLLTHSNLFAPVHDEHRIFRTVIVPARRDRIVALTQAGDGAATAELGGHVRLREAAFGSAPLAQVVVDREGTLTMANQRARAMFGLHPQDLGRPFQDLKLSYRPVELRGPIRRARGENRPVTVAGVEHSLEDGETQHLDIVVIPLEENGDRALGTSISFKDVSDYHNVREELRDSREELETAYEELQSANEELETTNEELQSTVEELQTTNEELQSSNEEMETINEELHTTNQEFQAKNEQLQDRTDELNRAKAFLESILASVESGIVVIDRDFEIMLWNGRAEDLWGLRSEEVIGRSLFSLDIGLPVENLTEPIRTFLAGDDDEQVLELEAVNRRGQSMIVQVTNTLRRGPERKTEGVVLLMRRVDDE